MYVCQIKQEMVGNKLWSASYAHFLICSFCIPRWDCADIFVLITYVHWHLFHRRQCKWADSSQLSGKINSRWAVVHKNTFILKVEYSKFSTEWVIDVQEPAYERWKNIIVILNGAKDTRTHSSDEYGKWWNLEQRKCWIPTIFSKKTFKTASA